MHLRLLGAALAALLATAGPAWGQPPDRVTFDSLGLAADAEPLAHRRLAGMGRCGVIGNAVVADTADLRRLRAYPQCAGAPFPDPARSTAVGVLVMGDCHTRYRLDAFRSERRREYRVRVQRQYGGCRAGGFADVWLELPPLPPGWTVAFTDEQIDDDAVLTGPGWSHIRGEGEAP